MREERSRDTPCAPATRRPWQFSENPWSRGDSWDSRHFSTLVELATSTGWAVWGRRKTEIASPSLARQYLGLIYGAHTFNLSPS